MADRNEIFRIILEGRDKLSRELDTVRQASDKLDQSLQRLKRNKPDEFPLFGGGKTARGAGGQFIKKEEIAALDKVRQKIDEINRSINILKRNKMQEFPLFGGGRAIRGDDGRFIRVQDVTLLEKAKNRLDAIDKTLIRIRTRIRRGPLVEGEEPGAGGSRLVRTAAGQFARAQDLTFIKRVQRELSILGRGIRDIQTQTRQGLLLGVENTLNSLKKVRNFIDDIKTRASNVVLGSGRTRTGVDPVTGRFISIADITTFGRFVRAVQAGGKRIVETNKRIEQSQRDIRNELKTGFKEGLDISKKTKQFLDERIANTRQELREARDALQVRQEEERLDLTAREDRLRREVRRRLELMREEGRLLIREKRKQIAVAKAEDNIARKEQLEDEIAAIQAARRQRESRVSADLSAKFQAKRAAQRIEFTGQKREIDSPDIETIEKQALEDRNNAIVQIDSSLKRMGARAGLAFGDIVRGAQSARKGLKDTDRDIRLLNNAFTRFGFAIGSIFKNFGQLVNLRWLFLTGILTTFFTILVQIGTALVAVAASAIQAAGAIGGAFLAAISQAIPVVGLLAAAMSSFNKVLDQVKLNEKLDNKVKDNVDQIRDASQRFADAQHALKKALEGVGDAQYAVVQANKDLQESYKNVRDATENLRDAKVQAARDIVDANLEEKDAALALAEAELGVLDAKKKLREEQKKALAGGQDADEARAALREAQERLRISREQGDQSEISSAQQQLTLAEQNLNAILDAADSAKTELKEAELGVKRATLTVEQARVRNNRAKEDAKVANQEGIKGSDIVKTAQDQLKQALEGVSNSQRSVLLANRNVRDSLHQVALAQRQVAEARKEETDARKGQTQADKDAQAAFADLAPAEKKLFTSIKRIRETFRKAFSGTSEKDGILGPITLSISRLVDALEKLLRNPRILRAAKRLADAIGEAIDRFTALAGTKKFQDDLIFFINEAINNLPKVIQATIDLFKLFVEISRSAAPLFSRLLDKFTGVTSKAGGLTARAAPGVGLPGGPGQGTELREDSKLDKFLASAEKHLDAWLQLGKAIGNIILAISSSPASGAGETLIGKLTDKLNELADWIRDNPESVKKFFDDATVAIANLAGVLGRLTAALVVAFSSEEFAAFAQVIAEVVIPGLLGLIFVLGKLSQVLLFILDIPIIGDIVKIALAFLVFEKGLNKLFPVTQKLTQAIKGLVGFAARGARVLLAPGGLKAVLEAITFQAGKALEATKKLGKNLLDLGTRWAKAAATGASKAKDAIFAMGNAAIGAATKIGTTLKAAVVGAAKVIGGQLIAAIKLLRLNIKLLLLSTGIGALIVAGLLLIENWDKVKAAAIKLWTKLKEVFGRIVSFVKENWKKIAVIILAPFLLGGAIILGIIRFRDRILGVFGDIKTGIINKFKEAFAWVRTQLTALTGWIEKKLKSIPVIGRIFGGGDKSPSEVAQSISPAVAERVLPFLPKNKQGLIAEKRSGGASASEIVTFLLESGLVSRGQFRAAVQKVLGKAGGWDGTVGQRGSGSSTDTVPAMLTPGEWVVNSKQQRKLASALGVSVQQAKAILFGTNSSDRPTRESGGPGPKGYRGKARNNGLGKRIDYYRDFNLVSQEDPDGITVWFLELANGSFGQVTGRDAAKIQKTNGEWIPNYVKRSAAGFKQNVQRVVTGGISGFSFGGVVGSPAVQRFAEGGVVQNPGHGTTSNPKTINQNFNVQTSGETDWGYVMRLGAVSAQEAY